MSLPDDPHADRPPRTGASTPPPAPPAAHGGRGAAGGRAGDGDDLQSLSRDLDVVQRGRPERAFNVGLVLGLLVAAAAVIFIVQNNRSTDFDWLWLDFELPLWTALVGALVTGSILTLLALAVHRRRRRRIAGRRKAGGRLRQAIAGDQPAEPPRRRFGLRRGGRSGPMQA